MTSFKSGRYVHSYLLHWVSITELEDEVWWYELRVEHPKNQGWLLRTATAVHVKGGESMSVREQYEQKAEAMAQPIIDQFGFELVDVEYVKEAGNWYLRFYID